MKNILLSILTAVGLIAASGVVSVTGAAPLAECQVCAAEFLAVENALGNAVFLGNNAAASQANLLNKLDAAITKAEQGKISDSIAKLQDIAATANALATAPKPKLQDDSAIQSAVTAAIACLSAGS